MPQKVKIIALLACLFPFLMMMAGITRAHFFGRDSRLAPSQIVTRTNRATPNNVASYGSIAMVGGAEIGAIVLLIDAIRRKYEEPGALAVALAVLGVLTIGMTSIVYYAIWGWMPAKPDSPIATELCLDCLSATSDRDAPGAGTIHGLFGTRFLGAAERCPNCGSSIKTLWLWFFLPVVPWRSCRVLQVGQARLHKSQYIGRSMPSIYWRQVWPVYAIVLGIVAVIVLMASPI